jgi:chemotaxis protein MotA
MLFLVGVFVVFGSVVTGYLMHHGQLGVLWQPNEFVIIIGAAIGSFIISNPKDTIMDALRNLKYLFKGKPYSKKHYLQALCLLFFIFKLMKTKGALAIEAHIDNPHESELFKKYPLILHDHHVTDFICDCLRLLVMGVSDHYQIEDMIDRDMEVHHHEGLAAAGAVTNMGDAMPALGIVAAVLGVITTMKSISEPPEVLGGLIAAALVGTFTGVLLSYGILAPMGCFMSKFTEAEGEFLRCVKSGLISHLQGNSPTISVEYIRKTMPMHHRPSFKEVEAELSKE